MNLRQKASLYTGVGLLALVGLLAFLGMKALEESTQRALQERVIMAQMVAGGVDQTLGKARSDLLELASIKSINLEDGNPLPERQALQSLFQFSRSFTLLFILDRNGVILFTQPDHPEMVGVPLPGYNAISQVTTEGLSVVSSIMSPEEADRPLFVIAVPLFKQQGTPEGLVGGWLELSRGGVADLIQPLHLGETAFAEIVSQEGLVMATTKLPSLATDNEETEYAPHFATLIKANVATQETCYRCHKTETGTVRTRDVLAFAPLTLAPGGVAIRQSETEALAPVRGLGREMLIVGLLFVGGGLFLTWVGARRLVQPILQLTTAAQTIAEGNLDTQVVSTSRDEAGLLANAFDRMRLRLRETLAEKEERVRESESRSHQLSALNSIAATVSQSLELDQILRDSLQKTLEILGLEAGAVFLKDSSGGMRLRLSLGGFPSSMETLTRVQPEASFAALLDPYSAGPAASGAGGRSLLHAPLASKGKQLGSMVLVGPGSRQFTPLDMELLTAVGHQIGTAIENAQLYQESQRRHQEAEALFRIGLEISRLLDLDKILNSVVDKACQLLEADAALLTLQEDTAAKELSVRATSGSLTPDLRGLRLGAGEGLAGRVVSLGEPVSTEDYLSDSVFLHSQEGDGLVRRAGLKAHFGVPLTMGERVFGCLSIASRERRTFSGQETATLQQLAQLAALAIENARLYGQVQDMAILEERERLAREMHDGLGQVLGYLQLRARGVEDLIAEGKLGDAQRETQEMRGVIRDAYEDVRQGILALRLQEVPESGLISMLEDYFEGFRRQGGIPLEVKVADQRATHFSSRVAVQLVRVVQEALANVRRHARASHATVSFDVQGQEAVIVIEDDGKGFDTAQIDLDDRQHFGLQTMRERCQSVGAQLNVESKPALGTRVVITLPLESKVG